MYVCMYVCSHQEYIEGLNGKGKINRRGYDFSSFNFDEMLMSLEVLNFQRPFNDRKVYKFAEL